MYTVKLNNNVDMPILGFGVYQVPFFIVTSEEKIQSTPSLDLGHGLFFFALRPQYGRNDRES